MGTVIVVASGKGGTGKTSLTGGIASCLAASGFKTLCLDTDVGLRNLDLSLGLSDRVVMDFTDVISARSTLSEAAVPHPLISGLYLLTAPIVYRPEDFTPDRMSALIAQIKDSFDYCLIDSPAGIGSGFKAASRFADRAIVVTTTDSSSLRDAQRTVIELGDFGLSSIHLVVNRIRPKLLKRMHTTIDDAMDAAGLPLLGVVPEDEGVILSACRGEPLILHSRKGAAIAYHNISRRLRGERVPLMKLR